jgi:glycosyltransferase involved in cell wall biosynthesis
MIAQEPTRTVRLHHIAQTLKKWEYKVEILTPSSRARFKPRFLSAALRYLGIMLQVWLAKAEVYYVFNNPDVGFPVLFKRGKFVYDVRNPWGAEVYDLTGQKFVAEACEWIERIMTRNADAVVAVNDKLAERARNWGAKKVFMVPNYPMTSFKPTRGVEEMRDRYDLLGKKIALFTGNFAEVECAFDLVKLFPRVVEKVPNGVLVMIGDGPQKSLIQDYIRENELEQSVRLINRIPRQEVPNWLAMADVVVVPRKASMRSSVYYYPESIWKVTEALRIGKPIVAGAVGGFVSTELPIRIAPLEKFHEAISEMLTDTPRTKPLLRISWNFCEDQLEKALEALS